MAKNKVIFGDEVIIDLTADTISKDKILAGYTAHDASGTIITGTCDYDANTQDATVTVAEILENKTAYVGGNKITGTMPNKGEYTATINTIDGTVSIPQGYHDGSGKVSILSTEQAKLIGGNIKQGITILGVEGTLEPSTSIKVQAKTVTPAKTLQVVMPDSGIDYLSQVTVNAIPYAEIENATGTTVVIG